VKKKGGAMLLNAITPKQGLEKLIFGKNRFLEGENEIFETFEKCFCSEVTWHWPNSGETESAPTGTCQA
jgi:hypothetical protein